MQIIFKNNKFQQNKHSYDRSYAQFILLQRQPTSITINNIFQYFHPIIYLSRNQNQRIIQLAPHLHIDHPFSHNNSMLLQLYNIIYGVSEHSIIIKFIYSKAEAMKYSKIDKDIRQSLVDRVLIQLQSIAKSARELGIKPSTAKLIVKRYREEGTFFERGGDRKIKGKNQKALVDGDEKMLYVQDNNRSLPFTAIFFLLIILSSFIRGHKYATFIVDSDSSMHLNFDNNGRLYNIVLIFRSI